MADEDDSSKTEQPTGRRLSEAEKKGDQTKSTEIGHWFALVGGLAAITVVVHVSGGRLGSDLAGFLDHAAAIPVDGLGGVAILMEVARIVVVAIGFPLLIMAALALAAQRAQHPIVVVADRLKPDLARLSPVAGFKRLFSRQGAVEFVKGLAKMGLVGAGAVVGLWPSLGALNHAAELEVGQLLPLTFKAIVGIFAGALVVLTFVALGDYTFQFFDRLRRLRMTRHEVKEEHKNTEGDPLIKGKRRKIARDRSRKRMLAAVPTADVVVTNPTHYAIALKYDAKAMGAPILVAKGVDVLAARIRKLAEEHDVPMVENPPLARALYATVEIDEEIPPEHYRAVAEVIGFLMKRRGGLRSARAASR